MSSSFAEIKGYERVANVVTVGINTCPLLYLFLAPLAHAAQYNDEDLKSENGTQINSTKDFCLNFGSIKLLLL